MFYPGRLCIPFGLNCNLHCRYCYRDICRVSVPNKPTNKFLDYLKSIPDTTYAIIASGGEPLLYWNTVQQIFETVPSVIHKKIMTNGSFLDNKKIKYINQNNIEIHLSYDGNISKYTRGYDVLEEKLPLIQKIHNLRILSVITNKNPDVVQVYKEIKDKLRRPFYFSHSVIIDTPINQNLIDGFDYDTYERSLAEITVLNDELPKEWYRSTKSTRLGFNYLLDGSVVGIHTLHKYGTVWDDKETLLQNFYATEDTHICSRDCPIYPCNQDYMNASLHTCRIQRIQRDVFTMINNGGKEQYVRY